MRSARDGDDAAITGEWRRLRRAAAFFLACLAVIVVAAAIGLYH